MNTLFSEVTNILIVDENNAPFILPLIRSFSGYRNIQLDVVVFSNEKPDPFRYSRLEVITPLGWIKPFSG